MTQTYSKLMTAAWNNSSEEVKLLIENGADINAKDTDGTTVLIIAQRMHPELITLFKKRGDK